MYFYSCIFFIVNRLLPTDYVIDHREHTYTISVHSTLHLGTSYRSFSSTRPFSAFNSSVASRNGSSRSTWPILSTEMTLFNEPLRSRCVYSRNSASDGDNPESYRAFAPVASIGDVVFNCCRSAYELRTLLDRNLDGVPSPSEGKYPKTCS